MNKSVELIDQEKLSNEAKEEPAQVKAILDTLHAIDNDYNLLNSPANIKTSSIVIEQQQHIQSNRYELRQRNSPFVSKLPIDPHLLRNSTPMQGESKLKLKLDESFEEKKNLNIDNVDSIGLNNSQQKEESEEKNQSRVESICTSLVLKAGALYSWRERIRFFAFFLIFTSLLVFFFFNKKSNFVSNSVASMSNSYGQMKGLLNNMFK